MEDRMSRLLAAFDNLWGEIVGLAEDLRAARADYDACYADIRRLGEALGHEHHARPVSASVVMREYIKEVAAITGRSVRFSDWHAIERE